MLKYAKYMNTTLSRQELEPTSEIDFRRPLDWVDVSALPPVELKKATLDRAPVFMWLDSATSWVPNRPVSPELILDLAPPRKIVTMDDVGIDFGGLAEEARILAPEKFRHIIRMGGSFDLERAGAVSPEEFEAYAVEAMGLDASLTFHGAEQARRMNSLMTLQQEIHQKLFADTVLEYGHTEKARAVYREISSNLPNFTPQDVKRGVLCGLIHDYGEAKLGVDVPLELKNDPRYAALEAGACVDFAIELHFPNTSASERQILALRRRFQREKEDIEFNDDDYKLVAAYLDPHEISDAIFGTEQLHHGKVKRGEAFAAVEKMEYVLSGIRALEAVEYNFQGVNENPVVAENLLRLGVSTFFRSLRPLMQHAEKLVYIYDFLEQNSGVIERYLSSICHDILVREEAISLTGASSIFGTDPFANYPPLGTDSETITRTEAKNRFLETAEAWKEWRKKDHLVKRVWESYVGADHPVTADNPDVSFLQKTAREVESTDNGRVAVSKALFDMWGTGLYNQN